MAVGITILSGSRQGEELGLEQPEFRAGDDPAYEIFFDPRQDAGAAGGRALFQLGSDGWYVKSVGEGPLAINGVRAEGRVRLRSNDVVRLTPAGPEFSFKLLASVPAGMSTFAPRKDVVSRSESQPCAAPTRAQPRRDWAMPALIALAAVVSFVVLYLLVRQPARSSNAGAVSSLQPAPQKAEQAKDETPAATSDVARSSDDGSAGRAEPDQTKRVADEDRNESDAARASAAPETKEQQALDDAVLLVLVEEPKTAAAWPFGTAAAIDEHTLLTSATVATGLAGFREKGWNAWATSQRLGLKLAVTDLRVHAGFVSAQGAPDKQIYADLGLLTVAEALPKRLSLAAADELAELDRGLPVNLLGYVYETEPVDRFQTFLPEPQPGKIFVITALPPSPGGPRLMHIRADLSSKMYGAPVLNGAGHVLGVFAETALPEPGAADLHLHYAPVADGAQIDRWIKEHDDGWWVPPVVSTH